MDLEKIQAHNDAVVEQQKETEQRDQARQQVEATLRGAAHLAKTVTAESAKTRGATQKVEVVNQPKLEVQHTNDYQPLLAALERVSAEIKALPKNIVIPKNEKVESVKVSNLKDYSGSIDELISAVKAIVVSPNITVSAPDVVVPETRVDLGAITTKLDEVVKTLKAVKPAEKPDFSAVEAAVKAVKSSIDTLSFPVPNYVLPFRDPTTGKATQVLLDSNGNVPTTATISGSVSVSSEPTFKDDPTNSGETAKYGKTNSSTHKQQVESVVTDGSGNIIGATSNALDINIKSGNPTSITANAGTNLNTSLLALEAGGNLASVKTNTDKIPSLGQAAMASSVPVVIASNQSNVPTKELRSTTGTTSQVADTASSTILLASNASRLGATIVNDSSAALYVKLGTTASTTDYTIKLNTEDYYEVPYGFTGRIDGIWATDPNDGAARITEIT